MDDRLNKKLHTGREIPVLGLGTWQLTDKTTETIKKAIDLGFRMIDTSSDYGTQKGIGKALKDDSIKREDIYIVTKVEEDDDSYERTKSNLDELNLDFTDLILIHRPPKKGAGEKLWEGLMRAKEEGLTKDIGVSNYPIRLLEELNKSNTEVPVINQIEWSPFGFSDEMLDYCKEHNIVIEAYSPLTRGERLNNIILKDIGETYNKTSAQVILRWDIQKEIIPIPKANKEKHLKENIDVFDFEIEPKDMALLDNINEEFSSLGQRLVYL